jgi:Mrp family chromosome partitioning ATPase
MRITMAEAIFHRSRRALNPLKGTRASERLETIPDSPFGEAIRLLALNLRAMLSGRLNKGVAVVSAYPGDGRSSIAANTALALAEGGDVLLVDSYNTERSALRELFSPRRPNNGMRRPRSLPPTTYATYHDHIWLLNGAGGRPATLGGLAAAVQEASTEGLFTIVDTPPAAKSSGAFSLAREVGQAIYVVRDRKRDMSVHLAIRDQLRLLGVEVIGLVVNEG